MADTPISVQEELPRLALRVFTDVGVPVIPPVVDRPVRRIMDGLVGQTDGRDVGRGLGIFLANKWPICDPICDHRRCKIVSNKMQFG